MLEIATSKIAQIILFGHEFDRGEAELRAFINNLNDDEAASLVAVMWIGRDSFGADELGDAIATAYREATTPTADYLIGTPHFADHLEAGLDALGIDVSDLEEQIL